jgi:DNA modification methylase
MRPFIREFTQPDATVLDPFCGFGTTLVAAHLEGRKGIGIEIDPQRAGLAAERLQRIVAKRQRVQIGTLSTLMSSLLSAPPVDLILSSLPYFGSAWRGAGEATHLYAANTYAEYLQQMRDALRACKQVLRRDGCIVLMIENVHLGKQHVPLAWDVARLVAERFVMADERILLYRRPVLHAEVNAPALQTNRAHEYALIAHNSMRCIDRSVTLQYLQTLCAEFPESVLFGSFADWLHEADTASPSDADVLLPNDSALIAAVAAWLEVRGFAVTRWGAPVDADAHIASLHAQHLRAERLASDGALCLFDLCYGLDASMYRRATEHAAMRYGVRYALGISSP